MSYEMSIIEYIVYYWSHAQTNQVEKNFVLWNFYWSNDTCSQTSVLKKLHLFDQTYKKKVILWNTILMRKNFW